MAIAVDHVSAQLEAIARRDPQLRACTVVREQAVEEAAAASRGRSARPLEGRTVAVKDNMDVAGTVRSDGLRPPQGPAADRDAVAVARLRAAGAVVVAKANLEELSFGATTQNAWWGECRNPWDVERLPGGSSGGCAVAVAAGFSDLALGTDTGGSLRNPAAFCGVTALRPTHGTVPMEGITPLSPRFDVCGPMARSAAELRPVVAVLTGQVLPAANPEILAGLRVGVPEEFFCDDLASEVAAGIESVSALLQEAGARLRAVRLPGAAQTPAALAPLLNGQAAAQLRRYWSDERVSLGIRRRIELGRGVTRPEHEAALTAGSRWRAGVEAAWAQVEVVLTPTVPFPAPPAGGDLVAVSREINRFNCAWSLTGGPSLSLPVAAGPLPVAAQLSAAHGHDARLLDIGAALQRRSDWHDRRPQGACG